jgi:hypothetical protein
MYERLRVEKMFHHATSELNSGFEEENRHFNLRAEIPLITVLDSESFDTASL